MNVGVSVAQQTRFSALLWVLLCALVACSLFYSSKSHASNVIAIAGDEVAVVNGSEIQVNSYPALTALLTGRLVSIEVNDQYQVAGYFFGHALNASFAGEVVDCGMASDLCQNVDSKVCLIMTDHRIAGALTPAEQLTNCSNAGGVGAIFQAVFENFSRTDMFDGIPEIPAVFLADVWSEAAIAYEVYTQSLQVDVKPQTAKTIKCGATHLGGHWVLTAAHCVVEQTPDGNRRIQPWEIVASVGAHDLRQDTDLAQTVDAIYLYETDIDGHLYPSDIALLKLSQLPLSTRSFTSADQFTPAIKIANSDSVSEFSEHSGDALVLGWGSTMVREPEDAADSIDNTSPVPLAAVVTLTPINQCRMLWSDYLLANQISADVFQIDSRQLCAYEPVFQRDTCQGDSGGPLLVEVQGQLELAGLTSFGLGCGSANGTPAVYTKVSEYTDWISQVTGINVLSSTPAEGSAADPVVTVNAVAAAGRRDVTGGGSTGLVTLLPLLSVLLLMTATGCRSIPSVNSTQVSVNNDVPGGQGAPNHVEQPPAKTAEPMNIRFDDDEIHLSVISNGCTNPGHFVVREDHVERCIYQIERTQPDFCKRASFVATVKISWNETNCAPHEAVFTNHPLSTRFISSSTE